jgi:hypothetical protein
VRLLDAERIEKAQRIGGEVIARVVGLSGRCGARSPRVAVVVTDHLQFAAAEQVVELGCPPVHGLRAARDEQQRGCAVRTAAVDGQLDAAEFEDVHRDSSVSFAPHHEPAEEYVSSSTGARVVFRHFFVVRLEELREQARRGPEFRFVAELYRPSDQPGRVRCCRPRVARPTCRSSGEHAAGSGRVAASTDCS